MMKWYVISVIMTILVLALSLWVTNKAYSRKWEGDDPENDPFDFDKENAINSPQNVAHPHVDTHNSEKA